MLVSEYQEFVRQSDHFRDRDFTRRLDIALYGLAGEVGSVVTAIKKRLLGAPESNWCLPNDEIIDELGDAFWYCFQLASILNNEKPVNILAADIQSLKAELSAENARAERLQGVLDPDKRQQFLAAAARFPSDASEMEFEDYQQLAFLTARTRDATLVEVCLSVLWQLNAELLRQKLPDIERELNTTLPDRDMNRILGETVWHLSALASLYDLKLSDIVARNRSKVDARRVRGERTPFHDADYAASEQLPRKFDISFVTLSKGRAYMYLDGRRLGDPLTDNNYEDDGYRYHDVMHLANAAVLGWSPVLRKLLGRKRRSIPKVDEVEDGARAQIVEEAVIKAIHSEGKRLAELSVGAPADNVRLFPNRNDVTFRLLNLIRTFVSDLEARSNLYWEWEDAVFIGHDMFYQLRQEGQGTITVDLEKQSLDFRPEICIELAGAVAAFGSSTVALDASRNEMESLLSVVELKRVMFATDDDLRMHIARKNAILDALGLDAGPALMASLDVTPIDKSRISVHGRDAVCQSLRDRNIIRFRTTLARSQTLIHCTALGVADPTLQQAL